MASRTGSRLPHSNGFPVFHLWGQKPILEPPYIEAHHRVCTYNETKQVTVKLPNCAPGVDPFYTYPMAVRCDCGTCSTATTECETIWSQHSLQNTAGGPSLTDLPIPSMYPFYPLHSSMVQLGPARYRPGSGLPLSSSVRRPSAVHSH